MPECDAAVVNECNERKLFSTTCALFLQRGWVRTAGENSGGSPTEALSTPAPQLCGHLSLLFQRDQRFVLFIKISLFWQPPPYSLSLLWKNPEKPRQWHCDKRHCYIGAQSGTRKEMDERTSATAIAAALKMLAATQERQTQTLAHQTRAILDVAARLAEDRVHLTDLLTARGAKDRTPAAAAAAAAGDLEGPFLVALHKMLTGEGHVT